MLEGGDRALGTGKEGLKMGEDLCLGQAPGFTGQMGWRRGGWRAFRQGRADLALCQAEPLPDALPGAIVEPGLNEPTGGQDSASDGELEEAPQRVGGQTESSDFVGGPDAESASAAGAGVAVAAEDSAGTHVLLLLAALVKTVQKAMANEGADDLAVRARRQLESLGNGQPFLRVTVKQTLLRHGQPPRK